MIPDEEPKAAPEPSAPAPTGGRRRTRRGGRRHSRRRGPRPAPPPSGEEEGATVGEPLEPAALAGEAATAPSGIPAAAHKGSGIAQAIEQVSRIIEELKQVLNEMEEVLETLELAERQKIEDEREIDSLQRALRQLHRPGGGGHARR